MQWVSATSITVTSGSAYIPSLANVLAASSAMTLSGLSLTASTWYHVYLYNNAGTPAIECVTTAPVLYNGTAYQKTGDNSRRYMGSVLTDAGGNIYRFKQSNDCILYLTPTNVTPFRHLTSVTTTRTTVPLTDCVPVTSRSIITRVSNPDTSANYWLGTSDDGTTTGIFVVSANSIAVCQVAISGTQDVTYTYQSAPTFTGAIDVTGYIYQR